MKRYLLIAAFAIGACSDEPVGESAYFDPWENPQVQGQTSSGQSADIIAINQQVEQKRLENAARIAAQSGDAALVASLEAAIETAGNDQRAQGQVITTVQSPSVCSRDHPAQAHPRDAVNTGTPMRPSAPFWQLAVRRATI